MACAAKAGEFDATLALFAALKAQHARATAARHRTQRDAAFGADLAVAEAVIQAASEDDGDDDDGDAEGGEDEGGEDVEAVAAADGDVSRTRGKKAFQRNNFISGFGHSRSRSMGDDRSISGGRCEEGACLPDEVTFNVLLQGGEKQPIAKRLPAHCARWPRRHFIRFLSFSIACLVLVFLSAYTSSLRRSFI
jgi:hypothetical protein